MADTKVSSMTAATVPLTGTELLYGDDGTNDVKVTTQQIRNFAPFAPNFPMFFLGSANPPFLTTPYASGAAGACSIDTLTMLPLWVPRRRQYTTYGLILTTLGTGWGIRLGLYNANQDTGHPTTKIDEAATQIDGSVATGSTGLKQPAFGANVTLDVGMYWAAFLATGTSGNCFRWGTGHAVMGSEFGAASAIVTPGIKRAFTYAALPADESAQTYTSFASIGSSAVPLIGIK